MAAAEPITAKFIELGLDENEAKILTVLYVIGPSKASSIAETAGLTRIQTYRILSRLQDRNIIETTLGRPVIFSVIPPDKAVDILITEASNKVRTMQAAKEQILAELLKFKAPKPSSEAKHRIIEGRSQIYSTAAKMIQSAKNEILFFVDKEDLMRMYYAGIPEELSSAFSKGVKIMILAEVDYSIIDSIQEYRKYAMIRHSKILGLNMLLVIDDSELLLSSTTKKIEGFSGESIVALWMNARNFVMGMKGLLEETWRNAIDAETRIKVLKEGGTAFQDNLLVKGTRNIEEFCVNMIGAAKNEISYVGIPFDDKVFGDSVDSSLKNLNQKGVKVRILTSVQNEIAEIVKSLASFAEIRHIDTAMGLNMLLVDKSKIMVFPSINPKNLSASAIWSSINDFIHPYDSLFANLWQNALDVSQKITQLEEEIYKDRLSKELVRYFSDHGYEIGLSLKGVSGSMHNFDLVGRRKEKSSVLSAKSGQHPKILVVDISASQDRELAKNALLGFIVQCIDIEADRKIFLSRGYVEELRELASSFNADVEVRETLLSKFFDDENS